MKKSSLVPDPADSLLEETRVFWHEVGKELIRSSITPLNEAAKQIIGVVTILEGLYFNAITFSDLHGKVPSDWHLAIYLAPISLLLISLTAALTVFFPKRYPLNINSSQASQLIHEHELKRKLRLLKIASMFLILGVAALFFAVLIYLTG